MSVLHCKSATHNADATTVGTKDDDTDPYGLQGACDNVAAGDEIRIWGDGTYNIGTQVDVDITAGLTDNRIDVNGANATGTVDGTQATLQASAAINSILSPEAAADFYVWRYLILDGNSNAAHCVDDDSWGSECHSWYRCDFKNANSDGFYSRSNLYRFVRCNAFSNGGDGFDGYGDTEYIYCTAHDNAANGIYHSSVGGNVKIIDSVCYDNGADGTNLVADVNNGPVIIGSLFFANTGDGLELSGDAEDAATILNSSFCDNGGYGIKFNAGAEYVICDWNHYHNNTSGETDLAATPGSNNQTGDPQFASVADGSEDFTPADASPLDGSGVAAMSNIDTTIGAAIATDAAGGGGWGFQRRARTAGA